MARFEALCKCFGVKYSREVENRLANSDEYKYHGTCGTNFPVARLNGESDSRRAVGEPSSDCSEARAQ